MKIHIYAQPHHHGDAYIIVDTEGLNTLIATLQHLSERTSDRDLTMGLTAFTEDGEGYVLFVKHMDSDDKRWEQLTLPYTDREIVGIQPNGEHPFDIIGQDQYRDIHVRLREQDDALFRKPPSE
jgi:hypothetical protein